MPSSPRLSDLLLRWQQNRDEGQDISAEKLCAECPEMLNLLRKEIQHLKEVESKIRSSSSMGKDSTAHGPGSSRSSRGQSEKKVKKFPLPGYELLGKLGQGGMGVVYKARQVRLNRLVAIKMLRAGRDGHADELRRFLKEGQALARFQHANVVQVYDVVEAEGRPFIVMEYCPNGSLEAQLQGRTLNAKTAGSLVAMLARAVHAIHAHGILHRDLKPWVKSFPCSDYPAFLRAERSIWSGVETCTSLYVSNIRL